MYRTIDRLKRGLPGPVVATLYAMKKLAAFVLAALIALPVGGLAQTFTFSTNSNPGVTISTNPFGTGVGVSTPYFNTVYTSEGYYDAYGHYHKRPHKKHHKKHKRQYRSGKAHHKAVKEARKAYHKEMKKQHKQARKHHRHHKR